MKKDPGFLSLECGKGGWVETREKNGAPAIVLRRSERGESVTSYFRL